MSHQEVDAAARAGDWAAYFSLMKEANGDAGAEQVPQPAPEHSSSDPWPDDFAAPPAVVRARLLAERLGWEVRLGYSRAFLKTGRGFVREHGRGARWVLHHLVQVAVRRPGGLGLSDGWIIYQQNIEVGKGWTCYAAMVDHLPVGVKEWTSFVESLTVEEV